MPTWKSTPERASRPTYLDGTNFTSAGVINVSQSYGLAASCLATPRGWEIQRAGAKPGNRELIVTLRGLGSTAKVLAIVANAANGDQTGTPGISWVSDENWKRSSSSPHNSVPLTPAFTHTAWIAASTLMMPSGVDGSSNPLTVTGLDISDPAATTSALFTNDSLIVANRDTASHIVAARGALVSLDARAVRTGISAATTGTMAQRVITVTFGGTSTNVVGGPNLVAVTGTGTSITSSTKVMALFVRDANGNGCSRSALASAFATAPTVPGAIYLASAQTLFGASVSAGPEVLIPTIDLRATANATAATVITGATIRSLFPQITGSPTITWTRAYSATATVGSAHFTTGVTFAAGTGAIAALTDTTFTKTSAAMTTAVAGNKYLTALKITDGTNTANLFIVANIVA